MSLLENIQGPESLKGLSDAELARTGPGGA